jgi:hypothetical protein
VSGADPREQGDRCDPTGEQRLAKAEPDRVVALRDDVRTDPARSLRSNEQVETQLAARSTPAIEPLAAGCALFEWSIQS